MCKKRPADGESRWFTAAKESGIPQLEKFAALKEKRLSGLISHALHPISTGRLEGFNNKIKG
ncbi:transposase [Bacteroides heparinolyticus]|uniref:transposase n=1 Tax=Prevotella heparinolytica TaxID=28113 RepID=UPI00359FB81A